MKKRKGYKMKKRMIGLCVVACIGIIAFAGCTGTEKKNKTSDNQISDTQSVPVDAGQEANTQNAPQGDTGNEKEDVTAEDTYADSNERFEAADLTGTVSGCSESGCTIESMPEEGTTSAAEQIGVVYSDKTIFQRGIVDSEGGKYTLGDADKSELKDNDFALVFGGQQADGSYQAERMILIEFHYD